MNDTKGDTSMTHNTNINNMPHYMYLDKDVYKLRLPAKGKDSKGNRINGARISLQTPNFDEAKFITNNLFLKYSIKDLNDFSKERLHSIIESQKEEYIENRKSKILMFALNLYGISLCYETALGFYHDSLNTDNTDHRIIYEKNLGLQIEKLIQETKSLDEALYLFNGKNLNDTNNIEYLSNVCTKFKDYYLEYISMKHDFDVACLRDPALKVYQDRINEKLGVDKNESKPESNHIKKELLDKADTGLPQITVGEIIQEMMSDKTVKHPDVVEGNIKRALQYICLSESDIFNPFESMNYTRKIKQGLIDSKSVNSKSSFKHYKSAIIDFLMAVQSKFKDCPKVVSELTIVINKVKQTWKDNSFDDSVPRDPFDEDDLKDIFNPNHDFFKKNPSDFWACVIALYAGSRSNMAHTLQYQDVRNIKGIDVIRFMDIADDDETNEKKNSTKEKKNSATNRLVPIHQDLINLGILDFVNKKRQHDKATKESYIFNELIDSDMSLKKNVNNAFFKFLESIGIKSKDDKINGISYCFHSFRVTAAQRMEDCGLKPGEVNGLIGWTGNTIRERYQTKGRTTQTKDLKKANEKLNYSFLKDEFACWKEYWANYYKNK